MEAKSLIIFLLLFVCEINSLGHYSQQIVHPDSEFAKVCSLPDKRVLILSSERGTQNSLESLLDEKGNIIYGNASLPLGYTGSSQLACPYPKNGVEQNYILFEHNKQNIYPNRVNENITQFKQGSIISELAVKKNALYKQKSIVSLKNGKILIAGISPLSAEYAETAAEINVYNPETNSVGSGLSFVAFSEHISCYEQIENEVYCLYVTFESSLVSKLMIKKILVNDMTVTDKGNKIIKHLYTQFNFVKAVKFSDNEAVALLQTGNGKSNINYGNKGGDLFYCHYQVTNDNNLINVTRYELLFDECNYYDDIEDYNADIIGLASGKVFATCQMKNGKLKGFIITTGEEDIKKFDFYSFGADFVKNPVFTNFDKVLGLFYTYHDMRQDDKVSYQLINFPSCEDYRETPILLPKNFIKDDFDMSGRIFFENAYPAIEQSSNVTIRFEDCIGVSLTDKKTGKDIEANKDYDSSLILKISPKTKNGLYACHYTSTFMDPKLGLITGKTCKINFITPKCLDQCYSCSKTGDEEHNYCLGCADGPYYEEEDPYAENEGFGYPTNCRRCNISCSSCFGPFMMKPTQTTNCKICDYANGYYHYFKDNRTCISKDTQEDWEKYLNQPIYLDTSPGPEKKELWRWRHCHSNCRKCHGPGTDDDNQCDECKEDLGLYFFYNQTKGNGIPGSCHKNCVDNGFFLKESEDMQKCYPCLDHCQKCPNEHVCNWCYLYYFLLPSKDACVDECPYCLAKDEELRECVNCKDREQYNLNGTCVNKSELLIKSEDPDLKGKEHHVIDETCNLVTGCKDGCFKCNEWYTEKCTQCSPDYYKEDFYSLPIPKTFRCFKEKECQGVEPYQFDKELKVGGAPSNETGELVCINCRLRNDSYRQVDDFICDAKPSKTYVELPYYNKLSQCYTRCWECDDWGNAAFQNCTECRDPTKYLLYPYELNGKYGNCYPIPPKCKGLPFYHDYDLATAYGYEDGHCGEDCDVCLTNGTCTENYPYYIWSTKECVEACPIDDILTKACVLAHEKAAYRLLINPFDLKDKYDSLSNSENLNKIISNAFFKQFLQQYNISGDEINNFFGNGKIYNLQGNQIILGNNITIEITSQSLQLGKLLELIKSASTTSSIKQASSKPAITTPNATVISNSGSTSKLVEDSSPSNLIETIATNFASPESVQSSIVDLSECIQLLKSIYNLKEEEDLWIIKSDTVKQISESYVGNQVDYQIFSSSKGAILNSSECKAHNLTVTVSNPFNASLLSNSFQKKVDSVISNGYDVFDSDSPFYRDVCTPFTNENGNDVLIDDRKSDYFNEALQICENGCTFMQYNISTNYYSCKCPVKDGINQEMESSYETKTQKLDDDFFKKKKNSNIEVFKCASQVFSSEGQRKNFGSYSLMVCFVSFVGVTIFHFLKGGKFISQIFDSLSKINKNNIIANPPKSSDREKNEELNEDNKVKKELEMSEDDFNWADYKFALEKDKRSYLQYYWSLLKSKQLFIFTFFTKNDHNLRTAKIALFILFISFYFFFTALFFNDGIMRNIYVYKGNTDAAVHIPNVILSSLACLIMSFVVRFVLLSERDIQKIVNEENVDEKKKLIKNTQKCLKIKMIILFAITGAFIILFWYYLSAFCAVFKNSQSHYFLSLLAAFIVCNIWPCVTSLIAPIFRRMSLKKDGKECMYKFCQIIAYI